MKRNESLQFSLVATPFGPVAAVENEAGELTSIHIGSGEAAELERHVVEDNPGVARAKRLRSSDLLAAYGEGEKVDFLQLKLADEHLTGFGREITAACRRIGYGKFASYGELAAKAGFPGAARAVGSVMRKNRWPIVVPCHRVLAAGNRIGGYSAARGLELKRELLALEGAPVLGSIDRLSFSESSV